MKINRTTPSGITRPRQGEFVTFEVARTKAKGLNQANGRGYRALKAANGNGYAVIFRPAVANNKQRKTRTVIV